MDQEWVGIDGKYDVVVTLVERSTSTWTDQGFAGMDEQEGLKRKRLSEPGDEDKTVGELHGHSNCLRSCSKYFETCLSKEWAGVDMEIPMRSTLDVHTDVKYYRECFTRMHSRTCNQIPNVEHGVKLLQVASQISYFSLVEDCVRYLTFIPWSQEDETRIREFAKSTFYPSDCASALSVRLVLPLSKAESHAICQYFEDAMRPVDLLRYDGRGDPINSQELFSISFQRIGAGPGPYGSVLEYVLNHVHAWVKKIILEAVGGQYNYEDPESNDDPGFFKVRWILELFLKTGFATELVKIIAKESALSEMLKVGSTNTKMKWVKVILDVFDAALVGDVLLDTPTRYMLFQNWIWILWFGADTDVKHFQEKIPIMLNTFVLTFPLETQMEIFSGWLTPFRSEAGAPRNANDPRFIKLGANWIMNLLEKMRSRQCDTDNESSDSETSDDESMRVTYQRFSSGVEH